MVKKHRDYTDTDLACRKDQICSWLGEDPGSSWWLCWSLLQTPNQKLFINPKCWSNPYRPTELDNSRPVRSHWEVTSSQVHWIKGNWNIFLQFIHFNTEIVLDQSNHSAELDKIKIFKLDLNIFLFNFPDHHRQCRSHTHRPGVF